MKKYFEVLERKFHAWQQNCARCCVYVVVIGWIGGLLFEIVEVCTSLIDGFNILRVQLKYLKDSLKIMDGMYVDMDHELFIIGILFEKCFKIYI